MMAPGKEVVTQADAANNPMLQRTFDRGCRPWASPGQLTRDQFVSYMQQRMATGAVRAVGDGAQAAGHQAASPSRPFPAA